MVSSLFVYVIWLDFVVFVYLKALQNAAAQKERTKSRSKGRENKRAAAANGF